MWIKSFLITLVGVGIAGGSVFIAKDLLTIQANASITEDDGLTTVVVARADIPFGQVIERQLLTIQEWPEDAVPGGTFETYEMVLGTDPERPRRAKKAISQGEIIMANKVSNFGEKVTIVQTLGENTRAMAIRVSAETAVGGFVTPGDFVDIVMTRGGGATMSAVTILQNIRVIGVDQNSNEENDAPDVARTITVEVSPEQGQKLALAQKAGTLSLTLRTLNGVIDEPMDMISLDDLLQQKSPVPDDELTKSTIKVRRANETTVVQINR